MRFRRSVLALVLAVSAALACTGLGFGGEPKPPPPPLGNPLLALPVTVVPESGNGRLGTGIPIGERTVLTCDHVVRDYIFLYEPFPRPVFRTNPANKIFVAGIPATITSVSLGTDETAAVLKTTFKNATFLGTRKPFLGLAYVIRPDVVHPVVIRSLEKREFVGWRPFRGSSGSGLVQWDGEAWRAVGVVSAKICDTCFLCRLTDWDCHCPKGGVYAALPVE